MLIFVRYAWRTSNALLQSTYHSTPRIESQITVRVFSHCLVFNGNQLIINVFLLRLVLSILKTSNSEDLHIGHENATETANAEQRVADLNWQSAFFVFTCGFRKRRLCDVRTERSRAQWAYRHEPRSP